MNAFILAIPLLLIRYGLLRLMNKEALKRAGSFAPVRGNEKAAFVVYQITTVLTLLFLLLLEVRTDTNLFYVGITVYGLGIILYAVATINYSKPKANGINLNGLYRLSRNPMYIAYFIYFVGCALLTQSWILLIILTVFQLSSHWIILSEERWCIEEFGEEYLNYMNQVRRYL